MDWVGDGVVAGLLHEVGHQEGGEDRQAGEAGPATKFDHENESTGLKGHFMNFFIASLETSRLTESEIKLSEILTPPIGAKKNFKNATFAIMIVKVVFF